FKGTGRDTRLEYKLFSLFHRVSYITRVQLNAVKRFLSLKARSKWNAWKCCKGMSKEEAMKSYIEKAQALIGKYGLI
ncbi:Putative acyl-coenzyme A binding protein, partial [Trichuris trichiura]